MIEMSIHLELFMPYGRFDSCDTEGTVPYRT